MTGSNISKNLDLTQRAQAHFVLIPRKRDFFRFGENLKNIIRKISQELEVDIISGRFNKEHLHLHISYPPHYPLESLISIIRNSSSKRLINSLREIGEAINTEHIWEDDYFITSMDKSDQDVRVGIEKYLESMKEINKIDSQNYTNTTSKKQVKSIVTGGAGFIGSNLVDELLRRGHDVAIIDDLSTGKAEYVNKNARFYRVDICDQGKIDKIFEQESKDGKIDFVFHLAAQMDVRKSVADPIFDNQVNVTGSINVFASATKYKVGKVVFYSTGGAMYGDVEAPAKEDKLPNPDSPYAIHKLAAEHNLIVFNKLHGLKYAILRPGNVFGPRQYKGGEGAVIAVFTYNIINDKESVIYGDGKQTRDYIHVYDVVDMTIQAAMSDEVGIFNVGTGKESDLFDLINTLERVTNKKFKYRHEDARPGEVRKCVLDNNRAKEIIGWKPNVSLEEGLSITIDWVLGKETAEPVATKSKKQSILVTGSAGFIGFHVAKRLLEQGNSVIGIDNFNDYYDPKLKEDRNKILEIYPKFKLYRGDLADLEFVKNIFRENNISKICHLAAQAGVRYSASKPHTYTQSNLVGFINLIDEAKNTKIENFVYASSSSVYGKNEKTPFSRTDRTDLPLSLYGATKKCNELIAHAYNHMFGLKCIGLRFFTVYGPWGRPDMAYYKFAEQMRQGKSIDIYNFGKMKRDFTYIDDIVEGVLHALNTEADFEIYNLGNDQPEELEKFVNLLEKYLGIRANKNYLPLQPGDFVTNWADITESRTKLGYSPKVNIEEGIKKFADWYKAYYGIK